MLKISLFFLSLFVLFACNKSSRFQNDLAGSWDIYQFKKIDAQGFDSYFKAEGLLVIDDFSDGKGKFSLSCTYTDENGTSFSENLTGVMESGESVDELATTFEENNQISNGMSAVLYHGKDNLKIEFRMASKRFELLGNNLK